MYFVQLQNPVQLAWSFGGRSCGFFLIFEYMLSKREQMFHECQGENDLDPFETK